MCVCISIVCLCVNWGRIQFFLLEITNHTLWFVKAHVISVTKFKQLVFIVSNRNCETFSTVSFELWEWRKKIAIISIHILMCQTFVTCVSFYVFFWPREIISLELFWTNFTNHTKLLQTEFGPQVCVYIQRKKKPKKLKKKTFLSSFFCFWLSKSYVFQFVAHLYCQFLTIALV